MLCLRISFDTATCFTTAKTPCRRALFPAFSAVIQTALIAHAQSLFPLRIKPVVPDLAKPDHLLLCRSERSPTGIKQSCVQSPY
jgi:hypothetical protein